MFFCFSPDFSILLSFFSRFSVSNIIFAFLFSFSPFFYFKNSICPTCVMTIAQLPGGDAFGTMMCSALPLVSAPAPMHRHHRRFQAMSEKRLCLWLFLYGSTNLFFPCSFYFVTWYYRRAYENIQELQQINYLASISSNRCWASSMYTLPVIGVLSGRHAVPLAHGWLALDDVRMVYSMYTISSFFSSKKKE